MARPTINRRTVRRSIGTVPPVDPPKSSTRPLLVFDGDCGFCTSAVDWLRHNLPAFPVAAPYQWSDLDAIGLTTHEAAERVWLVTTDHQYGGQLAVSAILRHQPAAGLRFAGWLMATPPFSWLAAVGYALIARYRYSLPGGTPACRAKPGQ